MRLADEIDVLPIIARVKKPNNVWLFIEKSMDVDLV